MKFSEDVVSSKVLFDIYNMSIKGMLEDNEIELNDEQKKEIFIG